MPGTYNFPDHKRGDTFPDFAIATLTDADTDAAIAVTSARLQVRSRPVGTLLLEWTTEDATLTITGAGSNVITLLEKSAEIMAAVATGTHDYDLEVVLTTGTQTLTLLAGTWLITADTSRS